MGSGPAGLLAAYDLRKMGYPITVFEALPFPGGMLAVGIPEYRLPRDILNREVGIVKNLGAEFRFNTRVGKDITLKELKRQFEAIFLAPGAHVSNRLGISGEDLEGVIHATDYLRRVNLGVPPQIGPRVVVVGGGNAAIDAARTARRHGGSEVSIVYRRSRLEMPAQPEEIEGAEAEGISIHFLATPVSILGDHGRVSSIECIRMELGEPDDSGRRRPIPVRGSEFTLDGDTVISAIGQSPDLSFLRAGEDLRVSEKGTIDVDPITLETSVRGVFAGGDGVTGPKTYIDAMAAGREAAVSIDRFLQGRALEHNRRTGAPQDSPVTVDIETVPCRPRVQMKALNPAERVRDLREVNLGLSETEAHQEASRCLQCGRCAECGECVRACEAKAISHEMKEEVLELSVGSIILTPGFDEFDPRRKTEYGYGRFPNVVSSIEFERFLSASGPFEGHIHRPSDHRPPKKVAWIQCVGSRDPHMGLGYCSSVCCMYATKEAIIARQHAPDLEASIFYMDMRAFGKDFDRYIDRARGEYGIRYIRSRISGVTEDPQTHDLFLSYETEGGTLIRDRFDIVVLSVGFLPSHTAQDLADVFKIELSPYHFAKTSCAQPLRTNRPGVFVGGAFSGPKDIPETVAQGSGAAAEAAAILAPSRGTLVEKIELPPEREVAYERPRIGVFVCHCGINIAGVVDVPEVARYAATLPRVVHVEDNLYTCSQDTQDQIKRTILEHRLNRVVVASCSPRTHEPLFQDTVRTAGLNRYLFEMANIRDQCSWAHMNQPREATEKAKDLVRMAVSKAALLEPLATIRIPVNPSGLVVGGGLAGLTSAVKLAEQGYQVYLVEKEKELGGNLRSLATTLEGENPQEILNDLIRKASTHPRIRIFKSAQVERIDGFVGSFKTTLKINGGPAELEHGIVIVATGAQEMATREYGYGQDRRVLTQHELESLLHGDPALLPAHDSRLTVCMIQCVGSRSETHPYCSRICCGNAIKNALAIKDRFPQAQIYILYRDIRTYGMKEDSYQRAREEGVLFIPFDLEEKPRVESQGGMLRVTAYDPLLQDSIVLDPDWLVLSVGIAAPESNGALAQMLKVPLDGDGFFLEAHMKLRPVDFSTDGVFLAGLAHGPKFIDETIVQANAAVSRACTVLSKEVIEVPGTVSQVDERRCEACGLCEGVCPYHAVQVVSKQTIVGEKEVAQVNEALCKGCGVCAASCRSGAIDLKGFSDEEIVAQIAHVNPL